MIETRPPAEMAPSTGDPVGDPRELEPFFPVLEPDVAALEHEARLDAGRERLAAAARARSRPPFDAEQVAEEAEAPSSEELGEPSAPFDFERETAVPRAA